jgi:hypothetical protein
VTVIDAIVPLPFWSYRWRIDVIDREDLMLAEALMRDTAFRPRRRHWAADADRVRLEARM